jgi:ADP-ribose pyrophosphatase
MWKIKRVAKISKHAKRGELRVELFTIPGVGGIIEKVIDGIDYILVQERFKEDMPSEKGLIEIPAGKIREYENIFECLKREIKEETGLDVTSIEGEADAVSYESNGYRVLSFTPFNCSQNLAGYYPIMVHVFICKVSGELAQSTSETKNIRWVSLQELSLLLKNNERCFYPMHTETLKKYLKMKNII